MYGRGGIGIHGRLEIVWGRPRAGSSPVAHTVLLISKDCFTILCLLIPKEPAGMQIAARSDFYHRREEICFKEREPGERSGDIWPHSHKRK